MMKSAKVSEKALKTSYLLTGIEGKSKNPHTITETVIFPAHKAIVNTRLGPQAAEQFPVKLHS